jgi:hypothetical protein
LPIRQYAWTCQPVFFRDPFPAWSRGPVQELQLTPAKTQPDAKAPRQNKGEQRRLINDAIGQLLVLLGQKAKHDLLTEKVEGFAPAYPIPVRTPAQTRCYRHQLLLLIMLLLLLANQMIEVIIIGPRSSRSDEIHLPLEASTVSRLTYDRHRVETAKHAKYANRPDRESACRQRTYRTLSRRVVIFASRQGVAVPARRLWSLIVS